MKVFEAPIYNSKFKGGVGSCGELVTFHLCSHCDPMQSFFRSVPTGQLLDEAIVVERADLDDSSLERMIAFMDQQLEFSGFSCCRKVALPSIHRQLRNMLSMAERFEPNTLVVRDENEIYDEWDCLDHRPQLHLVT